ncbi:Bug family tripartite tricarboxylate transporter substrate binding protein [Vreelandella profundi]|uniref:Bug family tripartite tricarboxylate transporter substrate binding protein n=1 Tax=Vreelandella profundi TaxID=2852117 RepID=UPI001EF05645|nr:tripartite tricarboxylate transporter substrate binding protein [Halomonas profundi]
MNYNKTLLATMFALLAPVAAQADFPQKNITIVVGYGPGGGSDITARVVSQYLEKYLDGNVSVVVRNVQGAGGVIALTQVSRAEPDGYTIGAFNVPASNGRMKDRSVSYGLDSFDFLAGVASDPNTLVALKGSGIETLDELAEACASEERLTLGVAGFGGEDHFAARQIEDKLGCSFTYVPLGGDGPARTAVMGGHVNLAVVNVSAAYNYQEALSFLGVMDQSRSQYVEEVPTFIEQGYDIEMASTRGYVLPAGTPQEIVEQYLSAFTEMFNDPQFIQDMGREAVPAIYFDAVEWTTLAEAQDKIVTELWENSPWK